MSKNRNQYEEFLKRKEQILENEKSQKAFLKKCKEQNYTTVFYDICKHLMIEADKRNIKNLKNYLLSDRFSKYAYEYILEFDYLDNENAVCESQKANTDQFKFEDRDSSQEELGLF